MTTPSTLDSPTASVPPPPPAAAWEDYLDIFYAPKRVYARRTNGKFLVPLLFLTVLMVAFYFSNQSLLAPITDAEWDRQAAAMMKQNPNMTAEQMATGREFTEKFGVLFVAFGVPIIICLIGLSLWLVGKLVESTQTLRSAFVVATFAYFPRIIEQIVSGAQGLLLDPTTFNSRYSVSLGLGRFFDPDTASPVLLAILGRVDVFTIWVTVLLGIGLMVTGRIPGTRAAVAAAIVWVLGAVPVLLGALRQG